MSFKDLSPSLSSLEIFEGDGKHVAKHFINLVPPHPHPRQPSPQGSQTIFLLAQDYYILSQTSAN